MSQLPDAFGCMKKSIKTFSGHYFDLERPNPDDVDIESIAHALSYTVRFGGHCPKFYSVAEHCLQCARLAWRDTKDVALTKAVLLHDAAEAYIGDMVKPLKLMISQFSEIERSVELAIERKFGIEFSRFESEIKSYDRALLKAEKLAMWPDDREEWAGFETIPLSNVHIRYFEPFEAEYEFLEAWRALR